MQSHEVSVPPRRARIEELSNAVSTLVEVKASVQHMTQQLRAMRATFLRRHQNSLQSDLPAPTERPGNQLSAGRQGLFSGVEHAPHTISVAARQRSLSAPRARNGSGPCTYVSSFTPSTIPSTAAVVSSISHVQLTPVTTFMFSTRCPSFECCICLEPAREGDSCVALPCGHKLHASCGATWLAVRSVCPLCKGAV